MSENVTKQKLGDFWKEIKEEIYKTNIIAKDTVFGHRNVILNISYNWFIIALNVIYIIFIGGTHFE